MPAGKAYPADHDEGQIGMPRWTLTIQSDGIVISLSLDYLRARPGMLTCVVVMLSQNRSMIGQLHLPWWGSEEFNGVWKAKPLSTFS